MSEYIVHVALMQDCFNIMLRSDYFRDEFKQIIFQERDLGEAASTTMSGDKYSWRIMQDLRNRWKERIPEDKLESKLAFVLGWVSHRAADRQMKPVFRALVDSKTLSTIGNDCTLYNEAKIYTEYYMNQEHDPYLNTMELLLTDSSAFPLDLEGTKQFFNGMLRMAFMRMHTMQPSLTYDVQGIEAWIDNISSLLQEFKINMELEAQIIAHPDPVKYQKYIVDSHFFDDRDPLIIVAKKLRFHESLPAHELDAILEMEPTCDYAVALYTALRYTRACHDYLYGDLSTDALCDALDIGKMGRDGQSV